jgi:hypothetical protein
MESERPELPQDSVIVETERLVAVTRQRLLELRAAEAAFQEKIEATRRKLAEAHLKMRELPSYPLPQPDPPLADQPPG